MTAVSSAGAPVARRRAVLVGHLLVVLVGLVILAYPFTFGATTTVTCRGVAMQPGSTCAKAGDNGSQTYEQRATDVRNARPVIAVGGLLVAGFGVVLVRGELRRRPRV